MRGNEAPQVNLFSYVHLDDRLGLVKAFPAQGRGFPAAGSTAL